MKHDSVKAVVIESIYPTRYPDLLSRQLGIKYAKAPYSVATIDGNGYLKLMDALVDSFKQALSQ
jgi:ABC-type Zn uptake system ZnuABC Zn-binding protein ZnuA